jgi:hypothetical protein
VDASWRGYGRRADLASASLARLRACEDHGVRFVIRLQENWQPKVDAMARGQVTPAFFPGGDLDALLADEPLVLDGRAIDADVPVGGATQPRHRRRVGVHTPTGDRCCLTPLLPRIGPWPGADLSRVRWEVARSLRLDQSGPRVDQMAAERPWTGKTRFQAALLASTLAARLAPRPHLQTRPPQLGAPRTEAPLRTRRRALPRAVSCQSIAQAFDLKGAEAKQRWDKIAKILRPSGKDPNGRRQPSVLDQLRGWKRQPVSRTNASKHHANVA